MRRGSIWRKWDLQVHTPDSFTHSYKFEGDSAKYNNDIWEKYICELETIKDVSVIGITDYFTIDGYKKVCKYKAQGRLANFDLILPNVELRLDTTAKGKRLNYHVIFSEVLSINQIEEHFFNKLYFTRPGAGNRALNRKNIEEYGRIIKEQNAKQYKGKNEFTVGCEVITIDLKDIVNILKENDDIFHGRYLLVLAEGGWEDLKWYTQEHGIKISVLFPSHAMFSSDAKSRKWGLGQTYSNPETFIKEFGSLKPCISGSDAHCFKDICVQPGGKYTWVKANPAFEGLKQILYEPEDRICLSDKCPEPDKNIYTLDSVKIHEKEVNKDLAISEVAISLNPNLVAVIGGKGTGKTAFLDLIANCFEDRCSRSCNTDNNSFVLRNEIEAPDLTVELTFANDSNTPFVKQLIDNSLFEESRITYLPQGQINEYSSDRTRLDTKIEEIIFNNEAVIRGDYQYKFNGIKESTKVIQKSINETNIEIFGLEEETSSTIMQRLESDLSLKQGELSNNLVMIKKVEENMGADTKKKISKLRNDEINARSAHSDLITYISRLELLNTDIKNNSIVTNDTINDINEYLHRVKINLQIPRLDLNPQIRAIANIQKQVLRLKQKTEAEIKITEAKIEALSGIEKQHADLLQINKTIKKSITELKREITDLENKKKSISELAETRRTKYLGLLQSYQEWKQLYKECIEIFSTGKNEILSAIDFESNIHFYLETWKQLGQEVMDNRKFQDSDMSKSCELLNKAINENDKDKQSTAVNDYLGYIFSSKDKIRLTRNNLDFYNWVFGDYFILSTNIYFNEIPLKKLSMGQKGTVLLKLFLAEGDYPLIIDQPEENLDNKYIFRELVGAFRQAKSKRQVIIATNNANLVVNADAEQIIVAEYEDNNITYKIGELEDRSIRDEITTILEGGRKAFEIREKKYAFDSL